MSNEELVAEIQAGAVELMGQLWEQVERLVKWKANHIMTALEGCPGRGVEFEDLYQSGYLSMVAAVNSYDPAAGASFSTWFMYYLKKVFGETTGYRTQKGREEPLNHALSIEAPLSDDANAGVFGDVIQDPKGMATLEAVEEQEFHKQLREVLEAALADIPKKYADVLRMKYYQGLTLSEIGEKFDVAAERVRQMENKGIRFLRKPKTASNLYAFYDFDFYSGTGISAFQHTGMSIQERYLMLEDERKERESRHRQKASESQIRSTVNVMMESIAQQAEMRVANMTQEERQALLKKYGYV